MSQGFRQGTRVDPIRRLSQNQVHWMDEASLAMLDNPGVHCFNEQAVDILDKAGCVVRKVGQGDTPSWQARFPADLVRRCIESAPHEIVLGARDPSQKLRLNSREPLVYYGTGSETNIFLESSIQHFVSRDDPQQTHDLPVYEKGRGCLKNLCRAAKVCNSLDNVDFYIRNVNIQDPEITPDNKDVNVFLGSLMYMTRHVQAGLVNIDRLDDVLHMARLFAGGADALRDNPLISFITCIIVSPLQMVDDTTEKLIAIARAGMPVVLSSSPQGGSVSSLGG